MGVEYRGIAGTGVIATIKGAHPGKCITLRGDIDALAVVEETGKIMLLKSWTNACLWA